MSLMEDLVISYRTLADYGVIDAYGHVSVRSERDEGRYWMARAIAPELVTEEDILEFDLDSNPIAAGRRAVYHERFIHGEIYKMRPDVHAVVHNHAPSLVPFSCTSCQLRPIFHMSAFIGLGVPSWDIREVQQGSDLLVRTAKLGHALASRLGKHPAALMRGHGSVVVGESLQRAVGRSVYLEQNARMQFQAMVIAGQGGEIVYLDDAEVAANVGWQDYGRAWDLWQKKWRGRLGAERDASRHSPHAL
jgi:HCOMODA/2-hydroxy-3-carboxy-muconic semialdehyde decarboxylase